MERQEIRDLILARPELDEADRQDQIGKLIEDGKYAIKYPQNAVKQINRRQHTIEFVVTADTIDRDHERVIPRAFEKDFGFYESNPVVLFAHNHKEMPPAQMIAHNFSDAEFTVTDKFAVKEYELAATLWRLYSADPPYMRAVSAGFIPIDWSTEEKDRLEGQSGRTYTRAELIEHSLVPIGSNRQALQKIYQQTKKSWDPVLVKTIEKMIHLPEQFECGHKAWYDANAELMEECPICQTEQPDEEGSQERIEIPDYPEAPKMALFTKALDALTEKIDKEGSAIVAKFFGMTIADTYERAIRDVGRAIFRMDRQGGDNWPRGTTATQAFFYEFDEDQLFRADWSYATGREVVLDNIVAIELEAMEMAVQEEAAAIAGVVEQDVEADEPVDEPVEQEETDSSLGETETDEAQEEPSSTADEVESDESEKTSDEADEIAAMIEAFQTQGKSLAAAMGQI